MSQSAPCPEGFSSSDACRLTGCTNNQLRYWDRIGLVKPSIRGTAGKAGVRRCYAFTDLVVMRSIKCLVDEGVSLQKIRRAFEQLKKHGLEGELGRGLNAHGEMLLIGDPEHGVVMDTLRQGQLVFFEVVEHVAGEVPDNLVDFAKDRETLQRAIRSAERDLLPKRRSAR